MEKTELRIYNQWDDHYIYDHIVEGQIKGQIEVCFDNGIFNGKMYYTNINSEDANGEFDWQPLAQDSLFEYVKEKAIQDYQSSQ